MFCGHKGLTGKLDTGNTIVNFIFPLYILGSLLTAVLSVICQLQVYQVYQG